MLIPQIHESYGEIFEKGCTLFDYVMKDPHHHWPNEAKLYIKNQINFSKGWN